MNKLFLKVLSKALKGQNNYLALEKLEVSVSRRGSKLPCNYFLNALILPKQSKKM